MGASDMAGEQELNRDIDVDLGGIFGSIWRNKFRLLAAAIVVTALTFVVLQVISPRYRSEARILIQASDSILTGPRDSTSTQIQSNFDDPAIASAPPARPCRIVVAGSLLRPTYLRPITAASVIEAGFLP